MKRTSELEKVVVYILFDGVYLLYIALGTTSMESMSRLEQMMFISSVQFSSVQTEVFVFWLRGNT